SPLALAHRSSPTAHCSLLIAHCSLLVARCSLLGGRTMHPMPTIKANGLDIFYDTFGKQGDAPLLLVMGLGAQMTLWDEDFCQRLADKGFFVVRYDNRDVGLSSKIEGGPEPDVAKTMAGDR